MQADEVLYLHPDRVRLQGPAIEVDADPLPDVVLEVDHTTDVRRRKLGIYMECRSMTLSTRRVSRCRILNERTWPIGIGWATRPMKRGRTPTYLPSTGHGGAGAPSRKRRSCARASGPGTG